MKRTAVYAGSFDPLTNGHLWMIRQGAAMFDELIVAIGDNPDKKYTFSHEERLWMLSEALKEDTHIRICEFHNRFLVDFAEEHGASFMIRGIRSTQDYEYERVMRHINADMAPHVSSIFLMPPRDIAELSSSMIKGLIGPHGWEDQVERYVPANVFSLLKKRSQAEYIEPV
ncbi:MAG: pantetheine-phosphate adenylyltransferase [Akkermansia sp.]